LLLRLRLAPCPQPVQGAFFFLGAALAALAMASSPGGGDISFVDYVASLPSDKVDALYGESRWTCAALLRALPPLGKHTVLRLLHVDEAFTPGAPLPRDLRDSVRRLR
jgi:hypothetical protein